MQIWLSCLQKLHHLLLQVFLIEEYWVLWAKSTWRVRDIEKVQRKVSKWFETYPWRDKARNSLWSTLEVTVEVTVEVTLDVVVGVIEWVTIRGDRACYWNTSITTLQWWFTHTKTVFLISWHEIVFLINLEGNRIW